MSLWMSPSLPALKYTGYHYKILKSALLLLKYILFNSEHLSIQCVFDTHEFQGSVIVPESWHQPRGFHILLGNKTTLWSFARHRIKKIKCVFGLGEEHLQKGTSMIVKVIAKKEEENIPFMKCKLPAVENY